MKILTLLILLITSPVFAQESGYERISDFSKESNVILNDQLRRTIRRIRDIESGVSLTTGVTGILPLGNGGTETAMSEQSSDRLMFWDFSEGEMAFAEISGAATIDTLVFSSTGFSNVIYSWAGYDSLTGADNDGLYLGQDQSPSDVSDNEGNNVFYKLKWSNSAQYVNFIAWKWTKISSVNTLTVNSRSWTELADVTDAFIRIDVNNGTTGTSSSISAVTSPAWQTFTVDVSGLTDGTTYDMEIQGGTTDATGTISLYLSAISVEGS